MWLCRLTAVQLDTKAAIAKQAPSVCVAALQPCLPTPAARYRPQQQVYHAGSSEQHRAMKYLYDMELLGEGRYLGYVDGTGAVLLVGSDERRVQVGFNPDMRQGMEREVSVRMGDEVAGEEMPALQVGGRELARGECGW